MAIPRLSPQVTGTGRLLAPDRVTEDATGAFVEWYGLAFRPGPDPRTTMLDSQRGPIIIQPEPNRPDTASKPFWSGSGLRALKSLASQWISRRSILCLMLA